MKDIKEEEQLKNSVAKGDLLGKIPMWLKVLFLKFWTAGALFYLFGVGLNITGYTLALVMALVLGLVYELFVRAVIKLLSDDKHLAGRYSVVNVKGFLSLILNLAYHLLLSIIIFVFSIKVYVPFGNYLLDQGINLNPFGEDVFALGPFGYGLIYLAFDFVLLFLKDLVVFLVDKAKYERSKRI